jgi:hypothetical protein
MGSMTTSTSQPSSAVRLTERPAGADAALRLHGEPPTLVTFDILTAAGLPHATTTRHCPGIAPAGATASPFWCDALPVLADAGLDVSRVAYARQVHGAAVARAASGGLVGDADVIVTTVPGQPLAVVTADCLPTVLYDPAAGALAVAHVGWRGTARRTSRAVVDALVALGADPASVVAVIGPSIGPCCYEVDRAVIDPLTAALGPVEAWVAPRGPGTWMLDLWAINASELAAAGLRSANIHHSRLCTSCRADLFYSYRRGRQGRLVTVASLPRIQR